MTKTGISLLYILLLTLLPSILLGQDISIANVSISKGFLNDNVEISGSGFSSTTSSLEVWFGASKATIVSSSPNFIIATVPAGCTTASITVLNKITGLSASSSAIFHQIYQGESNPDLTSLDIYNFTNSQELFDLVIVDLDNDGKNDILASKIDNGATTVVAFRNISSGSNIDFVEQSISTITPTSKVATGDIDGDGKQDIVLSKDGSNRDQIYVLRNTSTVGNISFAAKVNYDLKPTQFAQSIVIRDLDLDGKPEVVVVNTFDDEVSIFRNSSTIGNIILSSVPYIVNTGATKGNDLVIADFNNDGKHDLALTQFAANDIVILPNESSSGTLQFGAPITISINGTLNSLVAGDLNGDGKIDLAVTDPIDNKLFVILNQSTTSIAFGSAQLLDPGPASGPISLTLADFMGNGNLDIIVTSANSSNFTVYENLSSGGTLILNKKTVPQPNRSIAVVAGDLSLDAKTDLAFTARNAAGTSYF